MAEQKQYYDIKFPFTANNLDGFFIDLNEKIEDKKASEILHVLLTPKRSRIMKPNFGTDLIKFIFEPNDEMTWDGVKSEIIKNVSDYVSGVNLSDVDIIQNEDNEIYIDLKYTIAMGRRQENKEIIVKI